MKSETIIFFTLLIFISANLSAQKKVVKIVNEYEAVDKKALQMPDSSTKTSAAIASYISNNFSTDADKARAAFIWIATNIQYDIDNIYAINFYEEREKKISKALTNRKGICENYAALFNDVCSKCGLKSFVVEGYTMQSGFTDYIPHAWCATMINNSWFLFDPTWGSGYINNKKFYRKINNFYFKTQPSALLKSHMPFDYLWQFVNYPITNQEFYEAKIQPNKSKPFFNYSDSIKAFEKQTEFEQLTNTANRIEKNGLKNSMLFDRLQHVKMKIENIKIDILNAEEKEKVGFYNSSIDDFNEGISSLNKFIDYRNKEFNPKKSDAEIQQMLDSAENKFTNATIHLTSIKNPGNNLTPLIPKLRQSIEDAILHLKEQKDWLKEYFGKGKMGRKSMFRKYTWMGIPLN